MKQLKWLGGAFLVALLVTFAYATPRLGDEGFWVGYENTTTSSAYRTGISAVDSVDLSTNWTDGASVADVTTLGLGQRPTIAVGARFSDDGASATVRVVFYHYDYATQTWTYLGYDDSNSLSTVNETLEGVYESEFFLFDSFSATHALVLVPTASLQGGTVDLWVVRY